MTITEFLLARIAEDEKRIRYYGGLTYGTTREWAECAAKRAIVDARHEDDTCIRILAAVYSDHPDYNKAWRTV